MKKTLTLILLIAAISCKIFAEHKSSPPNIILIFCDDLGYADLSCYGSMWNQTPDIDQMAVEGLRFTDFYAGAPVCTPSRAGLMTGCYARRVDLDLDAKNRWVLFPKAQKGINPQETTLPEVLQKAGYSTAIIGKWHLGDQPVFLPVRHGFDYWFGLPYSNDMGIRKQEIPLLPLMQNEAIIGELNQKKDAGDQATLTRRYTGEAIKWMGEQNKGPFFLYMAHTMPHNPVAAREQFYNQTNNPKQGFGASVAEISWSTGEILGFLKEEGLADNTLVIFTSDNGGALHWGSSNGILKGRKGQTSEGGVRVPCIAWWPGKIAPGTTCNSLASVIDFFPTFAALAKYPLNDHVKRDGIDISAYLFNPETEQGPRPYFYWHTGYLQAVRFGDWKVNLLGDFDDIAKENITKSSYRIVQFPEGIELYNLHSDPGETVNVAEKNPDVVSRILQLAEKEKKALGEWTQKGPELRETLVVESPEPLIK
jgi:arylsulfatase A